MIGNRSRFKEYCCEDVSLIENYNEAVNSEEQYDCHHRLESHDENGKLRERFLSADDLIKLGKYYNVPASELIFMPRHAHISLHGYNMWSNADFRKNRSEQSKGDKNPFYNKHHSKETLDKARATKEKNGTLHKGTFEGCHHSDEAKEKMSKKKKGRRWFNNGEISVMRFECPEGFVRGRLQ